MAEIDGEARAGLDLMGQLRAVVRARQVEMLANPDPSDPWYFLIDPHAPFDAYANPLGSTAHADRTYVPDDEQRGNIGAALR